MKIAFKNVKNIKKIKDVSWWRVFIILIVPFLLSIWLFVFPWTTEFESIGVSVGNYTTSAQKVEYSSIESKYEKITKNLLSDILNIPFDFKTIMFCFEDTGSYYEYKNSRGGLQRFYDEFHWLVEFGDGTNMIVLPRKTNCKKLDVTIEYLSPIIITQKLTPVAIIDVVAKDNFIPSFIATHNTREYGKKNVLEVIQKSIILFLAWFGIIWLLTRAWALIKKEEKIKLWRVFIVLVIPFLLCIWFFVFPWSAELESTIYSSEDFSLEKIIEFSSIESDYKKITKNFLSDLLNIPFGFKTIIFCFEDTGSYYEYEAPKGIKRSYDDFYWFLKLTKEKNLTISSNETKCEKIEIAEKFVPSLMVLGKINKTMVKENTSTLNINFVKNTKVFGKKNIMEVIVKSIILFLAWFGIIWLLTRMWTLVKKK